MRESGGSVGRQRRRRWWARIRADDECLVDATRVAEEGLDECVARFDVSFQKVHESWVAFQVEREEADLEEEAVVGNVALDGIALDGADVRFELVREAPRLGLVAVEEDVLERVLILGAAHTCIPAQVAAGRGVAAAQADGGPYLLLAVGAVVPKLLVQVERGLGVVDAEHSKTGVGAVPNFLGELGHCCACRIHFGLDKRDEVVKAPSALADVGKLIVMPLSDEAVTQNCVGHGREGVKVVIQIVVGEHLPSTPEPVVRVAHGQGAVPLAE